MIICATDLETTGLDNENDLVTEIGAILWDTDLNAPVKFFNKLIKIDKPLPELIVKLTGLTDELLNKFGEPAAKVWEEFADFRGQGDPISMAHNAQFDRGFVNQIFSTNNEVWIDSAVDVPYPKEITTRKLIHLAAEHGFVNPFAHRAVTDVLTMCQVVSKYDWNKIIESAKTPTVNMIALVFFENRELAKSAGFRWDGKNKLWTKPVKENLIQAEVDKCSSLGFSIIRR